MKHLQKFESFRDMVLGSSKKNEKQLENWNKQLDFLLYDDNGLECLVGCEERVSDDGTRVINLHYFESEEKMNVRNPFYGMGGRETAPESAVLLITIPKGLLKRIDFYWSSDVNFGDPNIEKSSNAISFSSSSNMAKEIVKKLDLILNFFSDKKPERRIYR